MGGGRHRENVQCFAKRSCSAHMTRKSKFLLDKEFETRGSDPVKIEQDLWFPPDPGAVKQNSLPRPSHFLRALVQANGLARCRGDADRSSGRPLPRCGASGGRSCCHDLSAIRTHGKVKRDCAAVGLRLIFTHMELKMMKKPVTTKAPA